jgi:hypothetical protein
VTAAHPGLCCAGPTGASIEREGTNTGRSACCLRRWPAKSRRRSARKPSPSSETSRYSSGAQRTRSRCTSGRTPGGTSGGGGAQCLDRNRRPPRIRRRERNFLPSHVSRQGRPGRQHLAGNRLPQRQVRGRVPAPAQPAALRRAAGRKEFRQRFNKIDGVDLPATKLDQRPGFDLELVVDSTSRERLLEVLEWFHSLARNDILDSDGSTDR